MDLTSEAAVRRQRTIQMTLLLIIVATLPCYCVGFFLLYSRRSIAPGPTQPATILGLTQTTTPGGTPLAATITPIPFATLASTAFIPVGPTPTQVRLMSSTPVLPTWTPFAQQPTWTPFTFPTATPYVAPTSTPIVIIPATSTPVPPTSTSPPPTATATHTSTATFTSAPPTATHTETPTETATHTQEPPTATHTETATATHTVEAASPTPTDTPSHTPNNSSSGSG